MIHSESRGFENSRVRLEEVVRFVTPKSSQRRTGASRKRDRGAKRKYMENHFVPVGPPNADATRNRRVSMAKVERARDVVSGELSADLLQRRAASGWRMTAIEWQREVDGTDHTDEELEPVPY